MRKTLKHVLLALMLLPVAVSAASMGEGQTRLETFLSKLNTMEAQFIQTLISPRGELIEESRGTMFLARPGKFRLHYTNPYEQLYVADGNKMWMYDRDLEQVTVKPQTEALGSTPALLLSSSEPLETNFSIKELGAHEGFQWLELKPKAADSNFDFVKLAMEGEVLRAMEMVDGFGQTTRLYFETIERNKNIPADRFQFQPPPGVDVIGE